MTIINTLMAQNAKAVGRAVLRQTGRLAALLTLLLAAPGRPQAPAAGLETSLIAMRSLDQRVATIGYRLAVAANDLCARHQNLPGFAVHDLSQYGADYRAAAVRAFGIEAGPGVLALVPGGPAAQAGLRLDDVIAALDGEPLPQGDAGRGRSFDRMAMILDRVEAAFADGRATLEIVRAGARLSLDIGSRPGCATRFQLIPSPRMNAEADGRYVQVTTAIAGYAADDDELAAVLAHEFAHNILGHRVRLDQAHVSRGAFSSLGRNARHIRDTEIEADRYSIYLLDRAGYDPQAAIRFWERFGRRGFNLFGDPTHPNWRDRIALFETEIAAVRQARAQGRVPTPPIAPPPI